MYVSPQERPFQTLASGLGGFGTGLDADLASDAPLTFSPADAISRMMPPLLDPLGVGSAVAGGLSPLLQSLGGLLQQLSQALGGSGGSFNGYGANCPGSSCANAPQQYFGNASGSSTGDPHLAFSGNGSNAHWDSMNPHADLLDSNSFNGGFRISTQTTAPNANGVTYNGSATVATRNGDDRVTLDNAGNATVVRDGQAFALGNGQSYDLGGGERVSRGADGSVDISERNARGGSIETTLRDNGQGVDVGVQAQNVRLGGDLVGGANGGAGQPPAELMPLPRIGGHGPHVRPPHHVLEPVTPELEE
ncbi:MAG TPA: hypothetical protein VIG46_00225 [Candidatus Baltobacteraceae bacterium]|jgi:hypothetical protein